MAQATQFTNSNQSTQIIHILSNLFNYQVPIKQFNNVYVLVATNQIIQFTEQFTRHFSMNFSELILMMLKEYNGKKKSEIALFHFLLLSDLEGIMLGGSKSKLAKHGENLEKFMSGLFFS